LKVYTAKEIVISEEPKNIKEALQRHDKKQWMEAIKSELDPLKKTKSGL